MLDLNDPQWKTFEGGYRVPYDASVLLRELEQTDSKKRIQQILDEFWQELHHQGDVGLASCLAMPHLIRIAIKKEWYYWDIPALVAVIESERDFLPEKFRREYEVEIKEIATLIQLNQKHEWDRTYTVCALAAIAAVNKQPELSRVIVEMSSEDLTEKFDFFLDNYDEFQEWLAQKNK
jgi:hypothetical protein